MRCRMSKVAVPSARYPSYARCGIRTVFASLLFFWGVGAGAETTSPQAQAPGGAVPLPCNAAEYHQFDFWLGDWQVFDHSTGKLIGFDRVERQLMGCAVVQNLVWLSDD